MRPGRALERRVVSLLLLVAGGWAAWLGLLYLGQASMMFPGVELPARPFNEVAPADAQALWVEPEGQRSEAWWLPATAGSGPRPAVLFFHGNYELIDDWPPAFDAVREQGVHVVLVEYPGYGRSPGQPSRSGIRAASTAVYDAVAARDDVDPKRILAWGRSLGGGAATDLALARPVAGLLLDSTFVSVARMARRYLAPPFLIRNAFDNRAALRDFAGPVLITHGRRDEILAPAFAQELAAAADDATLVWRDCGHNDCDPQEPVYRQAVARFLARFGATV